MLDDIAAYWCPQTISYGDKKFKVLSHQLVSDHEQQPRFELVVEGSYFDLSSISEDQFAIWFKNHGRIERFLDVSRSGDFHSARITAVPSRTPLFSRSRVVGRVFMTSVFNGPHMLVVGNALEHAPQIRSDGVRSILLSNGTANDRFKNQFLVRNQHFVTHQVVSFPEFEDGISSDVVGGHQNALSLFLSFCAGRRVGVGYDVIQNIDGSHLASSLGFTPSDPIHTHQTWHSNKFKLQIPETSASFFSLSDKLGWTNMRRVLGYYCASHSGRTHSIENGISSVFSAIELLTNWIVQERGRWTNRMVKNANAADKIEAALGLLGISENPIPDPSPLTSISKSKNLNGSETLAWVRNQIVHPKEHALDGRQLIDAWNSMCWLVEVSMLSLMKYDDEYTDRRIIDGWLTASDFSKVYRR